MPVLHFADAPSFRVPSAHVYDATNPSARDFYWNDLAGKLFAQGWDAFWLDSAEPEEYWPHGGDTILFDKQLFIGNGAGYTNFFPYDTGGVQEHWKQTTDQKRVFLLTRFAFLGQQRNGTNQDDTIQRPLVMDWRRDPKTWNIGDEFMFGPSILVSPVLQQDATHREVNLPPSPVWYDFWPGARKTGGVEIDADAPLDHIPLYVRAGSILPLGPEIEYVDQKPTNPIELRIYRGADGAFGLYEDEGNNYNYEKGSYSVIHAME